ncbi:MAG: hypothetical protein U5N53_11930 [Mycobacterium sp.]|nr:hypothetical protein [Mycobacterium sp.]
MDATHQPPAVLTRAQLDLLKQRVEAGADPRGVALWISRITATGRLSVDTITAAAEDLRRGDGAKWYTAADAAAKESGTL